MVEALKSYIWVGIGSAIGGMSRFWVSRVVAEAVGEKFPWGTIVINVSGSFVIAILAALTLPEGRLNTSRIVITQLLMVGVCGGYTTFSSFSLQTLNLAREGQWLWAGGNILISVVACLIACWLGFMLGEILNK
jgi:CrcB protein